VELRLGASRKGVTLEIADNGKGFDLYELRRRKSMGAGIGLKNMEERLEPFDGHLDINSSPSGTRVAAQMPLRAVRVGNRIREPLGATT
jgi:two-component system NarL family sensor kinase